MTSCQDIWLLNHWKQSVFIIHFGKLDHSEWSGAKKKSKNFDGSSNMAIFGRYGSAAKIVSFEPDFSRTWNFQGLFLAILSTISESFSKIVRLVFEKSSKKHRKIQLYVKFWMIQHFFWKTAVYVSCPYSKELSCKKLRKSLEPFLRKTGNQPTNQLPEWFYGTCFDEVAGPKCSLGILACRNESSLCILSRRNKSLVWVNCHVVIKV